DESAPTRASTAPAASSAGSGRCSGPTPMTTCSLTCFGLSTPSITAKPSGRSPMMICSRESFGRMSRARASASASGQMSSSPPTPIGRLDAMHERVEAMLQATILVRPALEKFYDALSDSQKARFHAEPPAVAGDEALMTIAASGENELVPQICTDHPGGLSVQT